MTQIMDPRAVLASYSEAFGKQNAFGLRFESECLFALQQITKSDFTRNVAQNNQSSLKSAILNVAAVGISLNPVLAHAYLVPRDKAICLDVSYRGMVKLATDSGAIKLAKAVLVYEGDTFEAGTPFELPTHKYKALDPARFDAKNPLEKLLGGYSVAILADGTPLVDIMTAGEILEVRDASKAKTGPWAGPWGGEMAKKTLIKRGSKSWPQSAGRERLDHAIEILNQHEGLDLAESKGASEDQINTFMNLVAAAEPMPLLKYMREIGEDATNSAFNAAPKGEKTKLKQAVRNLETEAHNVLNDYVHQIRELIEEGDPAVGELVSELTPFEHQIVVDRLSDIEHRKMDAIIKGDIGG